MRYISTTSGGSPSLLQRSVAIIATVAVAGVALMFSAVLLTFLAAAGSVLFIYLWWKTRALRRQLREQMKNHQPHPAGPAHESDRGQVIEGEAIRLDDTV